MEYCEEMSEKIMTATPEEMKVIADEMKMEVFSGMSKAAQQKYEDFLHTSSFEYRYEKIMLREKKLRKDIANMLEAAENARRVFDEGTDEDSNES